MPTAITNNEQTDPLTGTWYRIAVETAVVAGVFSAIVCVLLLLDYAHRKAKDPLDSPQFIALKTRLVEEPQNEELKKQIRALDLELREKYFRQRKYAEMGGYLLLGGVVIGLIAAKTAATLRRKLPSPEPQTAPQDADSQTGRIARWSVAVLTLFLIGVAWALHVGFRSGLDEAVTSAGPETPGAGDVQLPVPANEPGYPTDEEIRRNWPRFRGPGGSGISADTNVPTSFDGRSGKGILWKTPVPLEGNNSPVVWEKRVFLSGATKEHRQVYCFHADTGKLLWQKDVPGTPQSTAKPPEVSEDTGYAACTMTTDGRRAFAIFANGDVAALDFAGNQVWARSLGIPENIYGHAASLTMVPNLLLVQMDQASAKDGKSKLLALEATTGKTVWEAKREVPNSWTSPIVINHKGRDQIITCGDPWVIAYNPADGSELWRAKVLMGDCGPSPVFADGVVHVGNEYCTWSAIRADGEGDVTETHVIWTGEEGLPDTCSPLVSGQFLLLLPSWAALTCYDVKTGKFLWEHEFEDAVFTSSPGLAGKNVYLFDTEGKVWIVEPAREKCKIVAEAHLGEPCVTSPAFQEGRIYIRGKKNLFCIGEK